MAHVVITGSASADVIAILNDLNAKAGLATVIKFRSLFGNLYNRLADFPGSGAPRPALGQNIRIGIVFPYIIIYRHLKNDDMVTVLRVLHGRRRITHKLLTEGS